MAEPEVVEVQPSPPAEPVETEPSAPPASAEPSETHPDAPPKVGGAQRRIEELTRARRLAELDAEFWKAKALGMKEAEPPATVEKPTVKPNPEDFETTAAYLDARDEWVREEARRIAREEHQRARAQDDEEAEAAERQEAWLAKQDETTKAHPDYAEKTAVVINTLAKFAPDGKIIRNNGPAAYAIAHALQVSEQGPELYYYLGEHPDELRELMDLYPTKAVIRLGAIEARLALAEPGGKEEDKPPMTKAPKPPTPIRKTSSTEKLDPNNPVDAEKMTPEEWYKAREAKRVS